MRLLRTAWRILSLTGLGVEVAIDCLQSATAFSFKDIDLAMEMPLLQELGKLHPIRVFYPDHLQAMQRLEWAPGLTSIQQDPELLACVQKIIAYENERSFLLQRTDQRESPLSGSTILWSRACASYARVRRIGGFEATSPMGNSTFTSRHFFKSSQFSHKVANISARVFNQDARQYIISDLQHIFEDWTQVDAQQPKCNVSFDQSGLMCRFHIVG